MTKKRALLLSGYHSISQESWTNYVLKTCVNYQWESICLPPRYFSWRMRGAPLSIAAQAELKTLTSYDMLVATSSIDLSVVQSIYANLRNTPSILYFHDNQFAYPKNNSPHSVVDWQMVNLYSAMRADKLIFNSDFNKTSFFIGLSALLKKFPDLVPKDIIENLEAKASVLAVPIANATKNKQDKSKDSSLKILWNHRWEWDKCPELLLAILERLTQSKVEFKLILTGQKFRNQPETFDLITSRFNKNIEHCGFIDSKNTYYDLIKQCDIVLSTAIHEFQGIAIMEAVNNGCIPLLPNRLSYPEYFSSHYLYQSSGSIEAQAESAVKKIIHWQANGLPDIPNLTQYTEQALQQRYSTQINS